MGKEELQTLVMFFLLTSAAFHVAVGEIVICHIDFVAAITATVPDHTSVSTSIREHIFRCQAIETLTGNIIGASAACFAAAVGSFPGCQQGGGAIIVLAAGAPTTPPDAAIFALVFRQMQNGQITKYLARQVC